METIFGHHTSGYLRNGLTASYILSHWRRHCIVFSDQVCMPVVSVGMYEESISNMPRFLVIFFFPVFLMLDCWIACSPAFHRRRYIVIKSMEPAALTTWYECKTIETTVYNWVGKLWIPGGLVFPELHTSTLLLFTRINTVSLYISNMRSLFSSLVFLGFYCS